MEGKVKALNGNLKTGKEKKEKNQKREECCEEVTRYLFGLYNLFFLLCGCFVCGIGVWLLTYKWSLLYLIDLPIYLMSAWLVALTGGFSVLMSLLGFTSVLCESKCALVLYTILTVLLFIFESSLVLLSYVYQEQVSPDLKTGLKSFISSYGDLDQVTKAVDIVQQEFKCCGANIFSDWSSSPLKLSAPDSRFLL